jgi:hypothetical protein
MLEFDDTEKLERFNLLQNVMARCPIGWANKQLVWTRATTQEQIIQWLCDIQNLCGVDQDGTHQEFLKIKERYGS